MKNKLIIFFILISILIIIFSGFTIILKQIYPKKYENIVKTYAQKYQVDELLIYAIIKAESNFKEEVVSNSGAIGLMQIMESTAEEIANELNIEDFTGIEDLKNIETNIEFGVKYFSDLLKEYDNNYLLALAAYNAGKGNVIKWINNGIIKSDGSDIENIPFKETNIYVRKIVRDYEIYQKIY